MSTPRCCRAGVARRRSSAALIAGDRETGITIMRMDDGLDTGPILLPPPIPIGPGTTAAELYQAMAERGAVQVLDALDGLAEGRLAPVPQPPEGATYARKLGREEGRLDWRLRRRRSSAWSRASTRRQGFFSWLASASNCSPPRPRPACRRRAGDGARRCADDRVRRGRAAALAAAAARPRGRSRPSPFCAAFRYRPAPCCHAPLQADARI